MIPRMLHADGGAWHICPYVHEVHSVKRFVADSMLLLAAIPKKARWKEVADTFDNIWNVLVWPIATTAGDVEHMYIDTLCTSWTSVYPFTALRHDMLMLYQSSGTTVPGFCMGCSMAQAFCRRSLCHV